MKILAALCLRFAHLKHRGVDATIIPIPCGFDCG